MNYEFHGGYIMNSKLRERLPSNEFETQMLHLENMVEAMGRGKLSFDQALDAYEKAKALEKTCKKLIAEASDKISQINKSVNMDGYFKIPGWNRNDKMKF